MYDTTVLQNRRPATFKISYEGLKGVDGDGEFQPLTQAVAQFTDFYVNDVDPTYSFDGYSLTFKALDEVVLISPSHNEFLLKCKPL